MTAFKALRAARAAGITVTLDSDALLLEASREPPQAVLDALVRHKLAILRSATAWAMRMDARTMAHVLRQTLWDCSDKWQATACRGRKVWAGVLHQ